MNPDEIKKVIKQMKKEAISNKLFPEGYGWNNVALACLNMLESRIKEKNGKNKNN